MRVRRQLIVVIAGLLCAACGARLDEGDLATAGAGAPGQQVAGVSTGQPTATTAPAGGAAPAAGAVTPGAPAGGGAAPAAGGDPAGGGGAPAAAACAPEGASDVGITPDSVAVGQVNTRSGPVPGLSNTATYGMRAFAAYINSQGGICGRQLQVVNADDRLDTGQNRAEHARLAEQVFAFVGGWSVVDDGGAQVLAGTNIPDVGLAVGEARAALANNFPSQPVDQTGGSGARPILQHIQSTYQPVSAAVVWGAQAVSRDRAQGYVNDLNALGMDVRVQREVQITETNYVPVAQEIENEGIELVVTTLEISGIARLAQALDQVGYKPKVPFYGAQTYGQQFLELAGPAAEGTILGITHPILEEAGSGGGVDTFIEWYQRANPGETIDFFSFQGWVAGQMFADALLAAGPAPTRDAVVAALQTQTNYDSHGLVAPFNPAGKVGSPCFLIVTVEGGQWRRVFPEGGGFHCA